MTPKKKPEDKKKMGRPRKLGNPDHPEYIEKLKAIAVLDITVEAMCAHAGIHPDTYYAYAKEHPEFSEEIQRLRETPYIDAATTFAKAIKTDWKAAAAWLERKKKAEYSPRTEITGADGAPLGGLAGLVKEARKRKAKDGDSAT